MRWSLVCLAAAVWGAGCGGAADVQEGVPPTPYAEEPAGASRPSALPATGEGLRTGPFDLEIGGLTFPVPEGWREVELLDMERGFTAARLVVPAGEREAHLTFSMVGGGIEPNIARWKDQVQTDPSDEPRTESLTVAGLEATWFDARGVFNGRSAGRPGPHAGWRVMGAGIPAEPSDVYLKLDGPQEAVTAVRQEFRGMLEGARK